MTSSRCCCPRPPLEQAAVVAARVASPHRDEPGPRVSCGIAAAPEDGTDAEALISHADSALYATKRAAAAMAAQVVG